MCVDRIHKDGIQPHFLIPLLHHHQLTERKGKEETNSRKGLKGCYVLHWDLSLSQTGHMIRKNKWP
jgi:hypothetical protein